MERTPTTRVLHVVESFGGGVVSALAQYVTATPELEHHLLRAARTDFVDDGELAIFSTVRDLSARPVAAAADLWRAVRALRPDVVHAHSSLAGALVRSVLLRSPRRRLVYTPHGFASDRQDVSDVVRKGFRAAEWLLSWNTDVVAGCSHREVALAERAHARDVVFVPNVVETDRSGLRRASPRAGRVVGVGRLSAQKDPLFFLSVVEMLRAQVPVVDPVWIGGGSADLQQVLVDGGVRVTGWLPRSSALEELSDAEVYLHTSAWDAGPMALLEATAVGVPAVARRVVSLPGLPETASGRSPGDVAGVAAQVLGDRELAGRTLESWRQVFAAHTSEEQHRRLWAAYAPKTIRETSA